MCNATIGDAINHIKLVGKGAYLAKTDIKSTFRILPINPVDYGLLGMKWKDKYHYYPTALSIVQITPKTSTNITRYLYSRGPA